MPHVIVKLWPGRPEAAKQELAEKITADITATIGAPADAVSVAIEEVPKDQWHDQVEVPDVINKADTLYKKPGGPWSID